MTHFSAKAQAAKILHGFHLSVRYQGSPCFQVGLWVNRTAYVRAVNKFCHLPCQQGHIFQGSKLFIGAPLVFANAFRHHPGSTLLPLEFSSWLMDPTATLMEFSHYLLFCLLPLLLGDALSFAVQLLSHTPTPLLIIRPAFEQKFHPLQIPRKPSCCKVCDKKQTRHSQIEISRLHWNLNSHFHCFWWAHSLWQRNQLSSAFSGY